MAGPSDAPWTTARTATPTACAPRTVHLHASAVNLCAPAADEVAPHGHEQAVCRERSAESGFCVVRLGEVLARRGQKTTWVRCSERFGSTADR
jgi:hypothetical protein